MFHYMSLYFPSFLSHIQHMAFPQSSVLATIVMPLSIGSRVHFVGVPHLRNGALVKHAEARKVSNTLTTGINDKELSFLCIRGTVH